MSLKKAYSLRRLESERSISFHFSANIESKDESPSDIEIDQAEDYIQSGLNHAKNLDPDEALKDFKQALYIFMRAYDYNHQSVIDTFEYISDVYHGLDDTKKELKYSKFALDAIKQVHGYYSHEVVEQMDRNITLLYTLKRDEEALITFNESKIIRQVLERGLSDKDMKNPETVVRHLPRHDSNYNLIDEHPKCCCIQ